MKFLDDRPKSFLLSLAIYASVCVAGVLIVVKFVAWWMTNSLSLQATLIDSLLDAAASFINLIAVRRAQQPPNRHYRFGHGKVEAIAAMGQSMFIAVSAGWLVYEAIDRLVEPEIIRETTVGITVMVFAMLLTLGLVVLQEYVVKRTGSAAIRADSLHYRSDFLINGGVIISLVSSLWFQAPWLDPVFGAGIAAYILYTAWTICLEAFYILMDRELPEEQREVIKGLALQHPKVNGLHDLRTRSSGLKRFIQLHLEMDGALTLQEAHKIADDVEAIILKEFSEAEVLIHQDPEGLAEVHGGNTT